MNITTLHIQTIQLLTELYFDNKITLKEYIRQTEERIKHIKKRAGD